MSAEEIKSTAHLGSYLTEMIRDQFAAASNWLVEDRRITQEEYELLTKTFHKAMQIFAAEVPEALYKRLLPEAQAEEAPASDILQRAKERIGAMFEQLVRMKVSYDASAWNGDASQWDTAEAYCSDCLIDMNSGSGPKTKDKCHLPYRKPGGGGINKNALRAMASGGRGLPALKGVPKDQIVKAANFMIRHWQGAFGKPAPDSIYRLAGKTPPGSAKSLVHFFKDTQGTMWAVAIYSNRWKDRQEEILSEASHQEFAEWQKASGFHPAMTVYHQPKMSEGFWTQAFKMYGDRPQVLNQLIKEVFKGFSIAEVERIVPMNGFVAAVGRVYPDMLPVAEKLAEMDCGMSHGLIAIDREAGFEDGDKPVTIVNKYRSFEVTILPREAAANLGTFPIFWRETMDGTQETTEKGMNPEAKAFFETIMPAEVVAALDARTDELHKKMDEFLAYKDYLVEPDEADKAAAKPAPADAAAAPDDEEDDDTEPVAPKKAKKAKASKAVEPEGAAVADAKPEEEVVAAATPAEGEPVAVQALPVDALVAAVVKALNVDELNQVLSAIQERQTAIETRLASLAEVEKQIAAFGKSEDERIAEKVAPKPIHWGAAVGPSRSEETLAEKETEIKKVGEPSLAPEAQKIDPNQNPVGALVQAGMRH